MSNSAEQYVEIVNDQFRGLAQSPTDEMFTQYEQACLTGILGPDVIRAFNVASTYFDQDFPQLSRSIDAKTPAGDYLFRCNGYAVVARESGITAVHAALVHIEKPVIPDPVEGQWPNYSNMGLIKAGRAVMPEDHTWPSLGHASSRTENTRIPERKFAGSTGMLFMHGREGMRDIRQALLRDTDIAGSIEGVNPIDQTAGLADEFRSQIALGVLGSTISIGLIMDRGIEYVLRGVNIH